MSRSEPSFLVSRRARTGGLFLLFLAACGPRESIPTYRVDARPFHHRVTAEGTIQSEKATRVTVPTQVQHTVRLAWVAAEGTLVEEGDVVARFDPTEMEERLRQGRSDLESATLKVDKSRIENGVKVAALDTDYRKADLELRHAERFRKVDEDVFSRNKIIEDQIDEKLAGERKEHAVGAKQRQQDLGQTDLELLAIEQRQAQLVIDQAEQGLQALEVRAPHSGILTLVRNWRGDPPQVGTEMWRGQVIAEIPDLSKMEAEVFVLEADAGGVEAGKPATMIVEADPGTVHAARVRRVDAVAKPRLGGSPVQYFGVTLELEETGGVTLKPGQRVRATLLLEELDDALVVPRQAVAQDQGVTRVFVREGGGFVPREVEIGASSMGLMVVTAGLAAGDVIALRPPDGGGTSDGERRAAAPVAPGGAG